VVRATKADILIQDFGILWNPTGTADVSPASL
jgi:hypothetical protein